MVGFPSLWRIRVGDYRVVYTIKDAELVVLACGWPTAARSTATSERRFHSCYRS